MEELKLLCSYGEWKKDKNSFKYISENSANFLSLSLKFNRNEEEEEEYQRLKNLTEYESKNREYTDLVHTVTDMYNKLKYIHDEEERKEMYVIIGKKQCLIEIIKEIR